MTIRNVAVAALLLVCLAGANCSSDDKALFTRAEELYRSQDYERAADLFKRYLLAHPEHSGAHLYLGSCFTIGAQWMTPAEGEIETALFYYNRDGKKSTIERFPDAYFELRCYFELIQIARARVAVLLNPETPASAIQEYMDQLRHWIGEAKRVSPEDPDVARFQEELAKFESLAQNRRSFRPRPQRAPSAPLPQVI